MGKDRKLKLSKVQRQVLRKIKNRQVKNVERTIRVQGQVATHPKTGKPLTASFVNLSNFEAAQFRKLERKGLISAFGKTEYFTNFKLTEKGKVQFRRG
jgi:hypothetical protein